MGLVGDMTSDSQIECHFEDLKSEALFKLPSEAIFAKILDAVPNAVVVVDSQYLVVLLNSATEKLLGYSPEELLQQSVETLIPSRYRAAHRSQIIQFFDNPTARNLGTLTDVFAKHKDGREVPVDIHIGAVEIANRLYAVSTLHDISYRKKEIEAIQKNVSRLERVMRDSPFPMMIHAEDGEIIALSDIWSELTGYPREELKTLDDWVIRAYGKKHIPVKRRIELLYDINHIIDEGEYEITTRNGQQIIWHFSSSPIGRLDDGRRQILSMAIDVTAQKQAERESHLLQTLTHTISECDSFTSALKSTLQTVCQLTTWEYGEAWVLNTEGVLCQATAWHEEDALLDRFQEWSEQLHFDRGEGLPGRVLKSNKNEWIRNVSAAPIERFQRASRALSAGIQAGLGVPMRMRGKVEVVLCFFMTEALDHDDKIVALISSMAAQLGTVFQRKQAEEALRESEERYRAVFEQAADSIVLIDPVNGSIIEFNDLAFESLGYTRSEFEKLSVTDLEAVESVEETAEHIKLIMNKSIDTFETKHRHKNGSLRDIIVTARLITIRGKKFILSVLRDITEQNRNAKKLQNVISEIAHQERLSVTGEMAIGIAHELNQPLSSICTYIDAMKARISKHSMDSKDWLLEITTEVNNQAHRASNIIEQMRSFVQKKSPHRSTLDLNGLITETNTMLASKALECGVRVTLSLSDQLPSVLADKILIQQALINLMNNSFDAMMAIKSHSRMLEIRSDNRDPHWVTIEVIDSGPGVPDSQLDWIFQPFNTTKPHGTGLGLTITRRILEDHQGHVFVTPHKPVGTVFTLQLPITQEVS